MPTLSQRAQEMPASPIRKLVPYADAAKKRGVKVYHLNIGQPDIETPPAFWDAVRNHPGTVLEYGHSAGLAEYREALAEYYRGVGVDVGAEHVLVTTGGSEAITFAFSALCDVGDEILCFEPFYTNYNGYAVQARVRLVPVRCRAEDGYHLPPEEAIRAALSPRTRAILICTPNNPTGTVLRRDELERVARVAADRDLWVISDEAYREFTYDQHHVSALALPELHERGILLDSISKRYSACGARVGCIVCRAKELNDSLLRFGQARLCPPTLEQIGALAVTRIEPAYYEGVRNEYQKRRDLVVAALERMHGVLCKKPAGAFYVMARLPVDDGDEFARWLLTDYAQGGATVMVAPGAGFYATPGLGKDEIRIAYVLKREDLRVAMACLAEGLRSYRQKVMGVDD